MNLIFRTIFYMTFAQMKARYRNTFAGFIWVILNPILMFAVHALIFKVILKIELENYPLFLLSGLIPWIFITSTLNMSINTLVARRELLQSFNVNPFILISSEVIDNAINFIATFALLMVYIIVFGSGIPLTAFWLIIPFILLITSLFFIVSFVAILQVFMRDSLYINQFINSIMYFLTPIFYPITLIPEQYRWLVEINPYYILIKPFQICLYNFEYTSFMYSILNISLLAIAFCILLLTYWRSKSHEILTRI